MYLLQHFVALKCLNKLQHIGRSSNSATHAMALDLEACARAWGESKNGARRI
jgi:hypothetical protein